MVNRRPILAACLIVAVFATAVLGVPGGRVICVGEAGHLAVAGAHAVDQKHECCCEGESAAGETSLLAAEDDCSDWTLDVQNLERGSQRAGDDLVGLAFTSSAWMNHDGGYPTRVLVTAGSAADSGGIPRAHLALIAPVVLLI